MELSDIVNHLVGFSEEEFILSNSFYTTLDLITGIMVDEREGEFVIMDSDGGFHHINYTNFQYNFATMNEKRRWYNEFIGSDKFRELYGEWLCDG